LKEKKERRAKGEWEEQQKKGEKGDKTDCTPEINGHQRKQGGTVNKGGESKKNTPQIGMVGTDDTLTWGASTRARGKYGGNGKKKGLGTGLGQKVGVHLKGR